MKLLSHISPRPHGANPAIRGFVSRQGPLGTKVAYTTRAFSGSPLVNRRFQGSKPLVSKLPSQSMHTSTRGLASHAVPIPTIHDVFESNTGSWQYVAADPSTSTAVIIDPVLDYDPASQAISTDSADSLLSLIEEKGYKIDRILETHVHADHLTAASYIQKRLQEQGHRPPIGIGRRIEQAQKRFGQRYEISPAEYENVFDKLFDDDETFKIGQVTAQAIHLPGHTPDHLGYKIGGKNPRTHSHSI